MAVGAPKYRSSEQKQKQRAYRQSDAGRLARKMYLMRPDVKQHRAMIRAAKRKMKAGFGG